MSSDCPPIVPRAGWNATQPNMAGIKYLGLPTPHITLGQTATSEVRTFEECKIQVKSIQNWHMNDNKWADIGIKYVYNTTPLSVNS